MNYQEFKEAISKYFTEKYPEAEVKIINELKNNGQHKDGLLIQDGAKDLYPIVLLSPFYEDYENGRSFYEIVDQISEVYEDHTIHDKTEFAELTDVNKIKDKIAAKVVNAERNAKYLESHPHTMLTEDLAIVYRVVIQDGFASAQISNELTQLYGLDADDLYKIALENMRRNNLVKFKNSREMLEELIGWDIPDDLDIPDVSAGTDMYYLSSSSDVSGYGAAAMMDNQVMDQIAEKLGGDFYILPSSVHELIILPIKCGKNWEELKDIVRNVNQTNVDPLDFLSDNVYVYDSDTHEIVMAEQYEEK